MINWYSLFANTLWILALAFAAATISYAHWQARQEDIKLGHLLSQPKWQNALNISGVFFCFGLAATTQKVWEQVIWLLMGLLFVLQIWLVYRLIKKE